MIFIVALVCLWLVDVKWRESGVTVGLMVVGVGLGLYAFFKSGPDRGR